ncbi:hypothetical protein BC629DRAFT_720267 [Irpex lacteus]|nr:hypothetical protein BC629DRAFT_720267 [Irpex lacteus]
MQGSHRYGYVLKQRLLMRKLSAYIQRLQYKKDSQLGGIGYLVVSVSESCNPEAMLIHMCRILNMIVSLLRDCSLSSSSSSIQSWELPSVTTPARTAASWLLGPVFKIMDHPVQRGPHSYGLKASPMAFKLILSVRELTYSTFRSTASACVTLYVQPRELRFSLRHVKPLVV